MTLQIIRGSALTAALQPIGVPARPLTSPAPALSALEVSLAGAGANQTGLWQCEPGKFERQLAAAEVMHILTGHGTFTPAGGTPKAIKSGDTLFFPRDTLGVWDIQETLRKVYVVFEQ